jgi:hypothetical protein
MHNGFDGDSFSFFGNDFKGELGWFIILALNNSPSVGIKPQAGALNSFSISLCFWISKDICFTNSVLYASFFAFSIPSLSFSAVAILAISRA